MSTSFFSLSLLLTMLALSFGNAFAAETKGNKKETQEEMEAREAQAEDEAERDQLDKAIQTTFAGKLVLDPMLDAVQPKVIGNFELTNGAIYPVKVSDASMLKALQSYNGKQISVYGKLRNRGKYLVISGIIVQERTAKGFSKRGGF